MDSNGVTARDQVLAELATLGSGDSEALTLLTQVRQLATFADQVQGELARLVRLADLTGAFAAVGYTCAASFLGHGCGRSAARAGELVAGGRALPRLRATDRALSGGQVSFDAAHVICRAVSQISDDRSAGAAEREMLSGATRGRPGAAHSQWITPGLDPRELRRLGEDLTYRADPDAVEERQRQRFERRYLSFGLTLDDVGTISGACGDALSLDIIKTAAEAFSPPGGAEDTRTSAQRRMDGLTAACQAALDSGHAGSRHGAMPHLTILWDGFAGPDHAHASQGGSPPAGPDPVDRGARGRRPDLATGPGVATTDATMRPARTGPACC
jgi:hypothetical protein